MKPKNILKPARLQMPGEKDVKTRAESQLEVTLGVAEPVILADDHDYAMESSMASITKRKERGPFQ